MEEPKEQEIPWTAIIFMIMFFVIVKTTEKPIGWIMLLSVGWMIWLGCIWPLLKLLHDKFIQEQPKPFYPPDTKNPVAEVVQSISSSDQNVEVTSRGLISEIARLPMATDSSMYAVTITGDPFRSCCFCSEKYFPILRKLKKGDVVTLKGRVERKDEQLQILWLSPVTAIEGSL